MWGDGREGGVRQAVTLMRKIILTHGEPGSAEDAQKACHFLRDALIKGMEG
jgi:hypothetical protein